MPQLPRAGRRQLRRGWQNATAAAAVVAVAFAASEAMPGAGAASRATAPTTPTKPSPTTLLSPPVIVNGGPLIGYMVWVRTPTPIGDEEVGLDLEISVPSLDLHGTVGTHSTPPTRSSEGGWCVRVELGYKPKGRQSDPPRVVTVYVKGTDGLKQTAYARLQTNKGGSAAAAGVPRAQSGCHKSNSGGPG